MNRAVWRIAGPMILSNLSVPLLGVVDTAVIGHLSQASFLGAVAVGTTIFNFIYLGMNFLRMGTTGITAQLHGTGDGSALRGVLGQSVLLALALAALLLVLQPLIGQVALRLMHPSADVAANAYLYFSIRIWSAPAVLANYALLGWFLGLQDARVPMAMLLVINVTNLVLDLLFVLAAGMKVDGVALGSVLAEYAGMAIASAAAVWKLKQYGGRWRGELVLSRRGLRRLIGINGNILVRTLALMFAFGFFTAKGAQLGDVILAANALLLNFQTFMAYGLDGIAHAAEALAGRAIGAGDSLAFRRAVRTCMKWSGAMAVAIAIAYALAGRMIIRGLTDLAAVREAAYDYLPWIVVSPIVSVWPFVLDGVFIGATRAGAMRNAMLLSTFACFVPAWYLLRDLGNQGLWLAFLLFLAARGVTMGASYLYIERRAGFVAT